MPQSRRSTLVAVVRSPPVWEAPRGIPTDALLGALSWACLLPTLPGLVAALGHLPLAAGLLVSTHALAALISFAVVPVGLSCVSPRALHALLFAMRAASGLMHASACVAATSADAPILGRLLRARVLHGLSGGSYAVGLAWIGRALPPSHRAAPLGAVQAATLVGSVLGPLLGCALAAAAANTTAADSDAASAATRGGAVAGLAVAALAGAQAVWCVLSDAHAPSWTSVLPDRYAPLDDETARQDRLVRDGANRASAEAARVYSLRAPSARPPRDVRHSNGAEQPSHRPPRLSCFEELCGPLCMPLCAALLAARHRVMHAAAALARTLVLASCALLVAGSTSLEATIPLIAQSAYGWSAAQSAVLWGAAAAAPLAAAAAAAAPPASSAASSPPLRRALAFAALAASLVAVSLAATIPWYFPWDSWLRPHPTHATAMIAREAVDWRVMAVGLACLGTGGSLAIHGAEAVLRALSRPSSRGEASGGSGRGGDTDAASLTPSEAASLTLALQLTCQLARCAGPLLATATFQMGPAVSGGGSDGGGELADINDRYARIGAHMALLYHGYMCLGGAALVCVSGALALIAVAACRCRLPFAAPVAPAAHAKPRAAAVKPPPHHQPPRPQPQPPPQPPQQPPPPPRPPPVLLPYTPGATPATSPATAFASLSPRSVFRCSGGSGGSSGGGSGGGSVDCGTVGDRVRRMRHILAEVVESEAERHSHAGRDDTAAADIAREEARHAAMEWEAANRAAQLAAREMAAREAAVRAPPAQPERTASSSCYAPSAAQGIPMPGMGPSIARGAGPSMVHATAAPSSSFAAPAVAPLPCSSMSTSSPQSAQASPPLFEYSFLSRER